MSYWLGFRFELGNLNRCQISCVIAPVALLVHWMAPTFTTSGFLSSIFILTKIKSTLSDSHMKNFLSTYCTKFHF
jgi:hypothetical protein